MFDKTNPVSFDIVFLFERTKKGLTGPPTKIAYRTANIMLVSYNFLRKRPSTIVASILATSSNMCPRCPSDYQEEHFLKQHAPCSAFPSLISEGDGGLFATSATCHSCCSSLTLQVPSILFERKRYCYQYPFCANSNNREHVPYPATTPPMTSRKGQRNCGTASSISTIVSKRKSISTRISTRRATITKLEICESIIQGVECRFGSKCAFAHSESELQFTTLRERAEAGLIDILTYRTRPCLDHVMTGSW